MRRDIIITVSSLLAHNFFLHTACAVEWHAGRDMPREVTVVVWSRGINGRESLIAKMGNPYGER